MKEMYKNNLFWLVLAIMIFLVNQLVNIVNLYPVGYDEAWYGSTAYNFAHGNGFLNTIVGSRGNANFLFPMIAGTFMHIFGYNLLAIRLANVFCGVLALLFIYACFRQLKTSWQACALAFLFFVTIDLYNSAFRWGRPEGCAMMCLAGGVWMYLRYKESKSWPGMIGLSFFAYIAACAHPFALLPFALMGVYQLIETIQYRQWKRIWQLLLLLVAAIAAMASITWASNTYNIAGENYVQERFSPKDALYTIPIYFGSIFLNRKHVLYMSFLIAVLIFLIVRKNEHKDLAIMALVHLLIFPVLFSSNACMAQYGVDYFTLMATILLAVFWDEIGYKKKWTVMLFICFCIMNLGISYSYNYIKHYDRVNTVLEHDLQQLVPKSAKVFGPIRQWPMLMDTEYQSEHTVFPINSQDKYDFIILNSQDIPLFPTYEGILPIDTAVHSLIYEKGTKQYGMIQVYRNKSMPNEVCK